MQSEARETQLTNSSTQGARWLLTAGLEVRKWKNTLNEIANVDNVELTVLDNVKFTVFGAAYIVQA